MAGKTDSPSEISASSPPRNPAEVPKNDVASVPEVSPATYREYRVADAPEFGTSALQRARREAFVEGTRHQEALHRSHLNCFATLREDAAAEARQRYPLPQLIVQVGNVEFSVGAGRPIWRDVGSTRWHNDIGRFLTGEPARVHKILKALLDVLEDHVGLGA